MDSDIQKGDGAADLTGATGDIAGAAGQTPAAEENAELAAFKAKAEDEVAKRQALEEDNRRLQEQLLAIANPPQAPEKPKDVFDGMEEYESPTIGQIRQIQAEARQNQTLETQQLLMNLQHQNFVNANPDYFEIVGTVGPAGRLDCAEPLKDLMKDIPSMRGIANIASSNPAAAQYAYLMAKEHKELKELRAKQSAVNEHQGQVENQLMPLSPASVGGGGGGAATDNPTDEQVDEAFDRALGGDFG